MQNWLNDPFVQSAVLPFLVALVVALLLGRIAPRWTGLALVFGVMATVQVMGIDVAHLDSTTKIVLLGVVAAAFGIARDRFSVERSWIPVALFVVGAVAITWVIWPVLLRRDGAPFWYLLAGAVTYAGWMWAASEFVRHDVHRCAVNAVAVGTATALCVLLGASAKLGQLGGAVAAAGGAYLVVAMVNPALACGSVMALPTTAFGALLGYAALVYARLPWYCLPAIALIPVLARVPLPSGLSRWWRTCIILVAVTPAVIVAVVLAWRGAGPPPL
jgi:hypothetical protein